MQYPYSKSLPGDSRGKTFVRTPQDYGVGLDVVVVVVVLDEFEGGVEAVVVSVVVLVSFVFSVVAGGFTTVVLFSVFFSAGEAAGVVTVSVFCSHAAKSAAPAKMQNSFFIIVNWLPMLGQSLNRRRSRLRSC
jgi:hypothetical protein